MRTREEINQDVADSDGRAAAELIRQRLIIEILLDMRDQLEGLKREIARIAQTSR